MNKMEVRLLEVLEHLERDIKGNPEISQEVLEDKVLLQVLVQQALMAQLARMGTYRGVQLKDTRFDILDQLYKAKPR